MQGLDLLDYGARHIYKVLLSAVMKSTQGIKALNTERIDQFLRKNKLHMLKDVIRVLPKIQEVFLTNNSMLPSFKEYNDSIIALASYYDSVEIYLLSVDEPIYIIIDRYGVERIIHIFKKTTTFWKLTDDEIAKLDPTVVQRMQKGAMGVCSFSFDPQRQPEGHWEAAIYPLTPITTPDIFPFLEKKSESQDIFYHVTHIGKNLYSNGSFHEFVNKNISSFHTEENIDIHDIVL